MDRSPSDETVRDLLIRRERELTRQIDLLQQEIAALRNDLAPKEVELEEVRRAKAALGMFPWNPFPEAKNGSQNAEYNPGGGNLEFEVACRVLATTMRDTPHHDLKIKELLVLAFVERFQQYGASPAELKAEIQTSYGRDIDPGSIRPNLARLREDGIVSRSFPPKWILRPEAAVIIGKIYFGDDLLKHAAALAWRDPGHVPQESNPAPETHLAPTVVLKVV